jgi:hypothetical protein
MSNLVATIIVFAVIFGFGMYGLFASSKRDDTSNTTETGGWMG